MATYEIKPDSEDRIRLIAEKMGVTPGVPVCEWVLEWSSMGDLAELTVKLRTRVTIAEANAILNA